MSVLLDALKKAAEEKKNLESGNNDNKSELSENSDRSSSDLDTEVNSSDLSTSAEKDKFSFKLADQVDGDQSEIKTEIPSLDLDKEVESEQSLVADLEVEDLDEKATFQLSEQGTAENAFVEPSLEIDSDIISDTTQNLGLEVDNTREEDVLVDKTEQIFENFDLSDSPVPELDTGKTGYEIEDDLNSLIDSLDTGVQEPSSIGFEEKRSNENMSLVNPDLGVGSSQSDTLLGEGQSVRSNSSAFNEPVKDSSLTKPHPQKDSFDWSLDDLPGYQSDTSLHKSYRQEDSLASNPILVSGANSAPTTTKRKYATSSKIMLSLMVIMLFVLIGFYGIIYYQEQSESLERSMMKYNIATLQIKPESQNTTKQAVTETKSNKDNDNVLVVVPKDSNSRSESLGHNAMLTEKNQVASNSKEMSSLSQNSSKVVFEEPSITTDSLVERSVDSNKVSSASKGTVSSFNTESSKKALYKVKQPSSKKTKTKPRSLVRKAAPVVKINRTKSNLAEGYDLYKSGDYKAASRSFNEVLKVDPKNLKALMGLGAIAVINKNYSSALSNYEKVLEIDPNNLSSLEAIANLSGVVALNATWEQKLLTMSELYPNSSVLNNASGNAYARKSDWLSAQNSYFNALSNSPRNPNYMVNLAVSYDHLGEYKLAAQYYTQALAYIDFSKVSFNPEQVKARLVSIRQLALKES